jgi:hypothetical protein
VDLPETLTPVDSPLVTMLPEAETRPVSVTFKSKFNLAEILRLYDIGRLLLPKKHYERWRTTLALGVGLNGVLYVERDGNVALLSVFWRTDNVNVDVRYRLPEPNPDGQTAYVCWLWNDLGPRGVLTLRRHIAHVCEGARYIAHHDQRAKGKRPARSERERLRGSSRVIQVSMRGEPAALRNGFVMEH